MGAWFLMNGMLDIALCFVFHLDRYMRPSEALELNKDPIIRPAPLIGAQRLELQRSPRAADAGQAL
jgi:hypothetical protein